MVNIDNYIDKKQWREDINSRKREIFNLIQKGKKSPSILERLGCVLLYNQFNEDLIKEILLLSYAYLTLKLKPKKIDMNLSFDNDTFGILINKFQQFAIKEYNYDLLLGYLKESNKQRNILTHQIIKIKNNKRTKEVLNKYIDYSQECCMLLVEYLNVLLNDIEWIYGEYSKETLNNFDECESPNN